jgi:protein-tyrosine phosphatase
MFVKSKPKITISKPNAIDCPADKHLATHTINLPLQRKKKDKAARHPGREAGNCFVVYITLTTAHHKKGRLASAYLARLRAQPSARSPTTRSAPSRDTTAGLRHQRTISQLSTMGAPELPAFLKQSKADVHAKFIDLEWQQRNRLLTGAQASTNSGQPSQWSRLSGDNIAARNRYLNVEPFAQNRIKLNVGEGVSDYINASPIQLGKRRYIATQGPKNTNVNHFYRMLNAEVRGTAVIVMLTQTHESGREKCFQYYPLSPEESPLQIPLDHESGDGFEGTVDLVSVENDQNTRSEIRHLRLRTQTEGTADSPEEKDIYHLLFSGWPDFLVPEGEDRAALTRLIQLSAKLNSKSSSTTNAATNGSQAARDFANSEQDNPRIVHCSAGVGRSGTFIALDYLLSLLYSGKLDAVPADKDPIMDTVDSLRQQRMMMVQGEGQYHFVYEALKQAFIERAAATNGHTVGRAGV